MAGSYPMENQEEENAEKRSTIDRLLQDDHVLVHLDPSAENTVLPEHLLSDPTVTLKLSFLFNGVMVLEDSSIEAELRFNGQYFSCSIPYVCIWGVTDCKGKSTIWPSSAPPNILQELLMSSKAKEEASSKEPSDSSDTKSEQGGNEQGRKEQSRNEQNRPKLRRVK